MASHSTPHLEAADAEIKVPSFENTERLKVLHLKRGVGQCTAIHDMLTARGFFLAIFYPSGPFTCIFSNLSQAFPVANTGSCVGPEIGHPAHRHRRLIQVPVLSARGI